MILRLSVISILTKIRYIPYGFTVLAWVIAVSMAIIGTLHEKRVVKSIVKALFVVDVVDVILITITCFICLYIWIRVRFFADFLRKSLVQRANTIYFLLFLNFVVAYSYYVYLTVESGWFIAENQNFHTKRNSWNYVFVCRDSLYVGVGFMLIQSLGNNLILILQKRSCKYIQEQITYYCSKFMRLINRHEYDPYV